MREKTTIDFLTGTVPSGALSGDLYLRVPALITAEKVVHLLEEAGIAVTRDDELIVTVHEVNPASVLRMLAAYMTRAEREESFGLIRPSGAQLRAIDGMYAMPLEQLRNRLAGRWLIDMLHDNRLYVEFQPIVRAKYTDDVFGYEALARGRLEDGQSVSPERMIEVARSAHMMMQFDQKAIEVALESAAKAKLQGAICVNCLPHFIYDAPAALEFTVAVCERTGIPPDRVVFEIIEVEQIDPNELLPALRLFQDHGFRAALDDLGSGYATIGVLSAMRPDFVKLDRSLISRVNKDPYKAVVLNKFLEATRVLGPPTIAEGIETEAEYDWACLNDATYIQGYFIAKPGLF